MPMYFYVPITIQFSLVMLQKFGVITHTCMIENMQQILDIHLEDFRKKYDHCDMSFLLAVGVEFVL